MLGAIEAGRTVLAPTAETAAALIDRIEAHFARTQRDVWRTPQIRDFSGWVRQQYERQNFDRAGAPRVFSDIEERQVWRDILARSDIAMDFSDPGGAARSARRAVRALREFQIPVSALSLFPSAEAGALMAWLADFEARGRQLNAIGADRMLESLAPPTDVPLWIESPSWHPQARHWLRDHAGNSLAPRAAGGPADPDAAVCVQVHRSFAAEIAACADWAQTNRCRQADFRAWICIPDLAVRRAHVAAAFDASLVPSRYSLSEYLDTPPYALAGGTPLAGLEPVRVALEALTAACERLSFAQFAALLRAPSMQAGGADAVTAACLDEALRSRAPSEASLRAWLEMGERVAALKSLRPVSALSRLQAIDAALSGPRSSLPLSQWVPIWIQALDAGPWAGRASWSSAAYQAAERFRELQRALACADQVYGPLSKSAAVHALATAAHETLFQAQTGIAPIWITDQVTDPWLNYDGIWITGLGADEWPPSAAPLPLIPVQLQRDHGVVGATAALQLERSLDLQRRWVERSAAAVFSCSTLSGMPAVPSALLPVAAGSAAAVAVQDPLIRRLRAVDARLEPFANSAGPPFTREEKTRGTFSLREQSQCAFRGFAMTRLRSDRLQLPVPGFNDMERGILLHSALEFIWTQLGGSDQLALRGEAELAALVDRGVERAIRAAVSKRDPGARWSAREARRLKRLLPLWLRIESEREPFDVLELEADRRNVQFGGLAFDVRIDRIDRLRDGSLVLIDYKSGTVRSDWEGERPDNPQLPIYALSVVAPVTAVAYAQVQARLCRFTGVTERDNVLPRVRAGKGEAADGMVAMLAAWAVRIERIAAELRAGSALVAPTPAACRSCHLQGFCRIFEAGGGGGEDVAIDGSHAA